MTQVQSPKFNSLEDVCRQFARSCFFDSREFVERCYSREHYQRMEQAIKRRKYEERHKS